MSSKKSSKTSSDCRSYSSYSPSPAGSSSDSTEFRCPYHPLCSASPFGTATALRTHMRIHLCIKPFYCTLCPRDGPGSGFQSEQSISVVCHLKRDHFKDKGWDDKDLMSFVEENKKLS